MSLQMNVSEFYNRDTNLDDEEDALYLLRCLYMSLSDEEGKTLIKRHFVLMNNYLDHRKNGIVNIFFFLNNSELLQ